MALKRRKDRKEQEKPIEDFSDQVSGDSNIYVGIYKNRGCFPLCQTDRSEISGNTTGRPQKQRVWLFVRNIKKCMENIGESYYSKIISL